MAEKNVDEPMTMSEAGRRSWTASPDTADVPELTEEDRRREEEIRAKLNRGEELTTEEAGFLGGVERVRQARKAKGQE